MFISFSLRRHSFFWPSSFSATFGRSCLRSMGSRTSSPFILILHRSGRREHPYARPPARRASLAETSISSTSEVSCYRAVPVERHLSYGRRLRRKAARDFRYLVSFYKQQICLADASLVAVRPLNWTDRVCVRCGIAWGPYAQPEPVVMT